MLVCTEQCFFFLIFETFGRHTEWISSLHMVEGGGLGRSIPLSFAQLTDEQSVSVVSVTSFLLLFPHCTIATQCCLEE